MKCMCMRRHKYNVELFCPKDFHAYSGIDVCLLFCKKRVCSVFKMLRKVNPILLRAV